MVTVGSLQAGTKENVIPDEAIIKLNVRTFDAGVRKRVIAAIERHVRPRFRARVNQPSARWIFANDARYAAVRQSVDDFLP